MKNSAVMFSLCVFEWKYPFTKSKLFVLSWNLEFEVIRICGIRSWFSFYSFGRSTLVGQRPMKSRSSVCPSVLSSIRFVKIGSLDFSDFVHDGSCSWYLVTDEVTFIFKKWGYSQNEVFCYFLMFGSLVFLEIAEDDSFKQCLTTSRDLATSSKTNYW